MIEGCCEENSSRTGLWRRLEVIAVVLLGIFIVCAKLVRLALCFYEYGFQF